MQDDCCDASLFASTFEVVASTPPGCIPSLAGRFMRDAGLPSQVTDGRLSEGYSAGASDDTSARATTVRQLSLPA